MSIKDPTKWRRNGLGKANCVRCGALVSTNAFALTKHVCKETGIKQLNDRLTKLFMEKVNK